MGTVARASPYLLSLLLACGGSDALTITSPADGAMLATRTVEVRGDVARDVTAVEVNGVEAAVEDGRFEARIELPEGPSEIVARAAAATEAIRVEVDTLAPRIRLVSPEPATFIRGTLLRVTGRVDDANLAQVTWGGSPIEVAEDGSFDVEREVGEGAQRMRLEASDSAGNSGRAFLSALTGHFAAPREPARGGVALRVGSGALQSISEAGSTALAAFDWQPLLTSANPIYDDWWGEVHIVGESHGEVNFAIAPRDGVLSLRVTVQQMRVDFLVESGLGDRNGKVEADPFVLETDIGLLGSAEGLSAQVGRPFVRLDRFRFDIDGVPGFIENLGQVRDEVRRRLKEGLVKAVEGFLPRWLKETFASLSGQRDLEVGGHALRAFAEPSYVDVSRTGLALDADAGAFALEPLEERTDAPGYLLIDRTSFDERVLGEDVVAAVSLDAMNAMLHALWVSGAARYRTTDLFGTGGTLRVGQLAAFLPSLRELAPADAPAALEVDAVLPPVLVPGAGGALEAALPDLRIRVLAGDDGTERQLLELSLGVRGSLGLVVHDGALAFEHGALELEVDPVSGPDGLAEATELDRVLREIIELGIDEVLSGAAMPLPDLEGLRLEMRTVRVRNGYLEISGPIVFEPDEA